MKPAMKSWKFFLIACAVGVLLFIAARAVGNDYVFFASYTVLQFIVLATAWNILGGYTGYVNFGSAAFFAVGAYTTVFFHKLFPLPIPVVVMLGVARGTYCPDGQRLREENRWETPAVLRAQVEDGLVMEWRVYADNEPMRELMRRTAV